ncbi:MAG TPA: divalent metal cation transporter, partial [Phycisphaerae bacterium]
TRLIAIIPAVIVISIYGDKRINSLLNVSQLILGLQLPLAMIPLMFFTSRRKVMGDFVNGAFLKTAGWAAVVLITSLDLYLIYQTFFGG